ncbi:MAG: hypothetical protein H0X33_05905 [Taibaiella sp.]|nr:hypothetical protein [Taibaiella sp.]
MNVKNDLPASYAKRGVRAMLKIAKQIILRLIICFAIFFIVVEIAAYLISNQATYIFPENFEGSVMILANRSDGILINKHHAIYDFTKSKIVKIKGDLPQEFYPYGYLNYKFITASKKEIKIPVISEPPEDVILDTNKIYVFSYYNGVVNADGKIFERVIVCKPQHIKLYLTNMFLMEIP